MSRERRRIDPTVDSASPTGWRLWIQQLGTQEQERLAEFGGIVLGGFIVAVLVLWAFAWVAQQVLDQQTTALDMGTLHFLQQFSSPTLNGIANLISLMGSQVVLVVGALLLAVFLWQHRWGAAVMLVTVTAGAQVLNDILKELFHRTRPTPVGGFVDAQQYSFPSGHAMVSAAFYFFIAYLVWRLVTGWWRGVLATGLIVLVLLIGLSRLYLEAHYLSDVIAGYLAGFLWTDAVILGARALAVRPRTPTARTTGTRRLQTEHQRR